MLQYFFRRHHSGSSDSLRWQSATWHPSGQSGRPPKVTLRLPSPPVPHHHHLFLTIFTTRLQAIPTSCTNLQASLQHTEEMPRSFENNFDPHIERHLQTALEAVRTRRAKQQLAEANNQNNQNHPNNQNNQNNQNHQQPAGTMRVPSLEEPARINRPPQPLPPSSSRVSRAPSPRRLRAASPPRLSSRPPSPRLSKPSSPRLSRTPSLKELATLMPR